MKDEDVVPQIKLSVFHFLFILFFYSFRVFFYAYEGLHRWSSHGEKAAKVWFDSQRKPTKKKLTIKVRLDTAENRKHYSKIIFKYE